MLSRKIAMQLGHAAIGLVAANLAREASPRRRLIWGVAALSAHYLLDTAVSNALGLRTTRLRQPAHESAA